MSSEIQSADSLSFISMNICDDKLAARTKNRFFDRSEKKSCGEIFTESLPSFIPVVRQDVLLFIDFYMVYFVCVAAK